MSGRLVSAVFASALPAWLKPYAAAFASFAADDGTRVFPSLARVARMVGRTRRSTRRAVAELRRRGILVGVAPSAHRVTVEYMLNTPALGFPQTFPQADHSKHGQPQRFPQFPQAQVGHPRPRGRTWVSPDPSMIRQFPLRTGKNALRAQGKSPKRKTAS
jgi:Helix-turn-helix domain